MPLEAYFTLALTAGVLITLITTRIGPDVILMGALAILVVTGILSPEQALVGFANPGVITIAVLYIVAAGLKETGAIQFLTGRLLGQPKTTRQAQARLVLPTSMLSAFMNNTAVVAMLIPAVQDWAQRNNIAASKLLLPLSYAAIMGGTLTLIGTSTNLVVDGLLQSERGVSLHLFELAWVGVPVLLVGALYLVLFGNRLLPNRQSAVEQLDQAREYSVEMKVTPGSPISGKTIQEAGLRNLQSSYLAEIERGGHTLSAVAPDTPLQDDDRLVFIGAPEGARELRRINGLKAANGDVQKLKIANHQRHLVEVVLGPDFPALGQTIKESGFRTHFKAVILSVSRRGSRVPGKLGEIRLDVGDTLLLEAGPSFVEQYRFRRDFLLVSVLNDSTPPDFRKAPIALALLGLLVLSAATGLLSILEAALLAAGGMLVTRCITASHARRSIDLSVLVVIAASFALGAAMRETGAAAGVAQLLLGTGNLSPWLALALVYITTVAFTETITNNAAAVLMFPIAMAVADQLGVNFMPFAIAIMFAASASFITPLGYQTNLMVLGPGGYRVSDYLKIGLPLSVLIAVTAIVLIPMVWTL
ncbi:SLC13 family permease [Natronospirillum operosum]|uniref:SLC13 family permease n=1 Tax=Natronospirillum operosum TaxID=2759953 RepID=A0A4Z0WH17_9GAMM|nr:SLC13 family permease [Natronospirillum operosum]TGG95247.1 SLC13 family permease [Natronospirillum operosum]